MKRKTEKERDLYNDNVGRNELDVKHRKTNKKIGISISKGEHDLRDWKVLGKKEDYGDIPRKDQEQPGWKSKAKAIEDIKGLYEIIRIK